MQMENATLTTQLEASQKALYSAQGSQEAIAQELEDAEKRNDELKQHVVDAGKRLDEMEAQVEERDKACLCLACCVSCIYTWQPAAP